MASGGMEGWISAVGTKVDDVSTDYATSVVAKLCTELTPFAVVLLTIWWFLLGWGVMRGEVQEPVKTVIWKAIKTSMIVLLALNAGAYNTNIADAYDGMRDSMALVVSASVADDTSLTGVTVWGALDDLQTKCLDVIHKMDEEASWYNLGVLLAEMIFFLGMSLLILASLFIAMLSKIFGTFFIATGPLFILCLLFRPTQRFFDGWLGMMANTIVLTWIGMFVAGFGVSVAQQFADAIFDGYADVNALGTSIQFCILCVIFALIVYQAPSWAAALTGGSSLQMGGAMARDAGLMMRSMSRPGRGTALTNNTNMIQAPGTMRRALSSASYGAGYGTGYAMRLGAQAGNRALSATGSAARAAMSGVRIARYKLAALRGRGG